MGFYLGASSVFSLLVEGLHNDTTELESLEVTGLN